MVNDEKGDLLKVSHRMLNRQKDYFYQLLNVKGACGNRPTELHTADPFVPEPIISEVEVAVGKLKSCKLKGMDQVPAWAYIS
jgi:hypothetical protein